MAYLSRVGHCNLITAQSKKVKVHSVRAELATGVS